MLDRYLMKAVIYAFFTGCTVSLIVITGDSDRRAFYVLQFLALATLSASYVIKLRKRMAVVGP